MKEQEIEEIRELLKNVETKGVYYMGISIDELPKDILLKIIVDRNNIYTKQMEINRKMDYLFIV